jgi:hypothetical protein
VTGTEQLLVALRAEGGTLAQTLVDRVEPGDPKGPAQRAASGPRAHGHEAQYELLIEMILEGSKLHYGGPRVVATEDEDLALLLGDQLYALGLSRLAALGDVEAVGHLADVISLVAQAHAAGDDQLADRAWDAGGIAVGWGDRKPLDAAEALALGGGR